MTILAQGLYDALIRVPPRGLLGRITERALALARRMVLLFSDPLVSYSVLGAPIKVPLSHNIGVYYRDNPLYGISLAAVAALTKEKYPDMRFIDVGANVGDTIPLLRSRAHFPILAIEGDARFFSIMEKNIAGAPDVVTEKCFLGEADRADGGVSFSEVRGTGHLVESARDGSGGAPSRAAPVRLLRLDGLLQRHGAFAKAQMIKVDTDGFDEKVLRGARGYLGAVKPVLFFEYAPYYWQRQGEDCLSVFPLLKDLGYERFLVFLPSGEFLCSSSLDNTPFLEELRLMHKRMHFYCDICAFSGRDLDLFERARRAEMDSLEKTCRW